MKVNKNCVNAGILFLTMGFVFGCSVDSNKQDSQKIDKCSSKEIKHFVSKSISKIIAGTHNAGNNVQHTVDSCRYQKEIDVLDLELSIAWDGKLSGKRYAMQGTLEATSLYSKWNTTAMNSNLEDWENQKFLMDGFKKTNNKSVVDWKNYNTISIDNQCGEDFSVAVCYTPIGDKLTTKGWYNIKAGAKAQLTNVKTKLNKAYFFAMSGSDRSVSGKLENGGVERTITRASFSYTAKDKLTATNTFPAIFTKMTTQSLGEDITFSFKCSE